MDKKIDTLNREELRDFIIVTQDRMNNYMRAARKNFELACTCDRRKEEIEERLRTLEDFPCEKPNRQNVWVGTPSAE